MNDKKETIYMLWQMYDVKQPLPKNIQDALEHHKKKYGPVPNLVEYSDKHPRVSMDGIHFRRVNIPANILLLAVE